MLTIWLGLILIIAEWFRKSTKSNNDGSWEEYCKYKEEEISRESKKVVRYVHEQLGEYCSVCQAAEDLWWVTILQSAHNDLIEFYIHKQEGDTFIARCMIGDLLKKLKAVGISTQSVEYITQLYGADLQGPFLSVSPTSDEEFPSLPKLIMTLVALDAWRILKEREGDNESSRALGIRS